MRKLLLTIITIAIICLGNLVNAQAPNWAWAKSAGGTYSDLGYSVATDASGNVFMTGEFSSATITFGTTTLTKVGSSDIFIVKYDASRNVLWAKSAGGTGVDVGSSVATDASGNVFMTGWFNSPIITFGTTTITSAGSYDIFIVKYDASGNVLWAKSTGSTSVDAGKCVSTDASGNVFMTGWFESNTITFGTNTLTNVGSIDNFIVKYDASGNVLWAKCAGGSDIDYGLSVASDASGNVFMTGYFISPTITFGTTTLTNAGPIGTYDIFIAKYDSSGNVIWAKSLGGTSYDEGLSIATDASGNVLMTGVFGSNTITFGTTTLANYGNYDIFIAKVDSSGNVLWAKSAGGTTNDYGKSISTNSSGDVFMTGWFDSPILSFGTSTLTNAGNNDIFIAKYDGGGNVVWAKSAGGTFEDEGNSVATDPSGNVFMSGWFISPTISFGINTLTNAGSYDIFIAKLDGTTGIESAGNTNSFSIYPNPAINEITISNAQLTMGKTITISISDITGKLLYNKTSTATERMEVNTKDFAAGVYLVQVQTTDFVQTRKVIVGR